MLQKRINDQLSISRAMIREAEGMLHRRLRPVGLKHAAQRNTILRTFLETREHLSMDEQYRPVRKKDSKVGFTTVYPILKLLAGCGLASEVDIRDGITRYEHQYNRRSHHHMVCTACGSPAELPLDHREQEIGQKHRLMTTCHTFQIYSTWEDCRKENGSGPIV